MAKSVNNIRLKLFRKFLQSVGCEMNRIKGGHEIWTHPDASRPIIIQSHIDPIPAFIVLNNLKTLGITKEDFFKAIEDL
jgi:predicted RNA binding protein YcfA (HicA-like mRNA interferase family)